MRHIHKAEVLDRVLHHAVMRIIEPIFEKRFIFDSYSSRKNKGTHKAVKRLRHFAWKLSRNNTKTVWVLKADIRKFFDSINHAILSGFLKNLIGDERAMALIEKIIRSFAVRKNKGIPLGNLTSQLFSNIYLNELDQFVKRELRERHYIRYADDFAIVGENPAHLENIAGLIEKFLKEKLDLEIHPQKIIIKKWSQGIDFLGYVALPHYTTLRTKTKRRIFKKIKLNEEKLKQGFIIKESFDQSLQSYYGILTHCSGYKLKLKLINILRQRKC